MSLVQTGKVHGGTLPLDGGNLSVCPGVAKQPA
jgi:hypothetical protein